MSSSNTQSQLCTAAQFPRLFIYIYTYIYIYIYIYIYPEKGHQINYIWINDHSDGYIFAKETISADMGTAPSPNNKNIEVVSKNCAPFTDCISEINNTQVDNARDNEVVTSIYNLIEHSNKVIIIQKHLEIYGSIIEMNQIIL